MNRIKGARENTQRTPRCSNNNNNLYGGSSRHIDWFFREVLLLVPAVNCSCIYQTSHVRRVYIETLRVKRKVSNFCRL